jgi:predicted amidophosphoribosyltransferase
MSPEITERYAAIKEAREEIEELESGKAGSSSDENVCPSCGEKVAEGMKFCGSCGAEVGEKAEEPAEEAEPESKEEE